MLRNVAALAASALIACTAAHAASVVDGSFEQPDYGSPQYHYSNDPALAGSPWTYAGGAGITTDHTAWEFLDAPDGDQVAFLQNVASISQDLAGLTIGQTYTVSFDLARRTNFGAYQQNPVTVSFGGLMLATETATSAAWQSFSTSFVATGTTGTLAFSTALPFGDNDSGLDAVAVAGAPGAVPETSTWAMLVMGFGAIGGAVRRRGTAPRLA